MTPDERAPTRFRPHQELGQGREFDTIRALMALWGDLVVDIGDDAAVLPAVQGAHVISTDASVEGVHFRREWLTPQEIGARAATAALSDLAAMGARAVSVLVAFVVPEGWRPDLLAVAAGLAGPIRAAGAHIVGGNLSRGETFGITLTVIGDAARAIPRSGARPGDLVVVTGRLGGPGAALAAWQAGATPSPWARARFAHPTARLREGQRLADAGATAMLDISDGLAADARHLASASGVALVIEAAKLPCGEGIAAHDALGSGEEYELLATLPPAAAPSLLARWHADGEVPLTIIGRVEPGPVGHVVVEAADDGAGPPPPAAAGGHDHFALN